MNTIKYMNVKGEVQRVRTIQPSYATLCAWFNGKIQGKRHPTVAEADQAMGRRGFFRPAHWRQSQQQGKLRAKKHVWHNHMSLYRLLRRLTAWLVQHEAA